MTMML